MWAVGDAISRPLYALVLFLDEVISNATERQRLAAALAATLACAAIWHVWTVERQKAQARLLGALARAAADSEREAALYGRGARSVKAMRGLGSWACACASAC